MSDLYQSDRPIHEEKEDKFQRYGFSKRIAETIANRKTSKSIVIGIYGAWGEGKTSVINFIGRELKLQAPDVIQISFNPWRFSDESTMLRSFFNTLANALIQALKSEGDGGKKPNTSSKEPLKKKSEKIGDVISKYANALELLKGKGIAEAVGGALSNVSVEDLKHRLEKLLEKYQRRIVIFIDDIDRLDRDEINSIFRIVKLTGDFPYTNYILSFDDKMVASAIGSKFENGGQKSGENFLEKIIQVPLRLPLAQKPALRSYCIELLNDTLMEFKIEISEEDARVFVELLNSCILLKLDTPRLAVRYGNSLSFVAPLLQGEVNLVDLFLFEAIHIFYPEIYSFIREFPSYFVDTYNAPNGGTLTEKVKQFKTYFSTFTNKYNNDEALAVQKLLVYLFPNLKYVWSHITMANKDAENNYYEKRMASPHYFNRYLSYTVIEGDISDIEFDDLMLLIKENKDQEKTIATIKEFLKNVSVDNFVFKLKTKEKFLTEDESINVIKVLALLGDHFPGANNLLSILSSPFYESTIFITHLIENNITDENKFQAIQYIVEKSMPFNFCIEIYRKCRMKDDRYTMKFEQTTILDRLVLERGLKLANGVAIFKTFNIEAKFLLHIWAIDLNRDGFDEYITEHLNKDAECIIPLVKVFTPYLQTSLKAGTYYGDLDERNFRYAMQVLGDTINLLFSKIIEHYNDWINPTYKIENKDYNQTEENLINQFIYWHKAIVGQTQDT